MASYWRKSRCARFEVLMVVRMTVLLFWVEMLCRLTGRYQHFGAEDGDIMFLQNVGICLQVCMALQLRRPASLKSRLLSTALMSPY
jgi:hypothetical protein